MSKRTILSKVQQKEFLNANRHLATIRHKWSYPRNGRNKILDSHDNVLGEASGYGYDRYGAALGNAIEYILPNEVLKLALKECKQDSGSRKGSANYYGLFYSKESKEAYLDGGCGDNCMVAILNKIGFSLNRVGSDDKVNNGVTFYTLTPINDNDRRYLK